MEFDKLDIAYSIIIIGIIILLVDLSVGGHFGFNIIMRPSQWAAVGLISIGITGILIGTCSNVLLNNNV